MLARKVCCLLTRPSPFLTSLCLSGSASSTQPLSLPHSSVFCSVKHGCNALTRSRCSWPTYRELWVSSFHLQEPSDTFVCCRVTTLLPWSFTLWTVNCSSTPAMSFFWLPLGPMLSSLGARPFRKAARCLVYLPFHGAPSVFTTIGCALIVTPSGRNPRAMCHRRSLELTFTSKSHERMVMTLAYLAAANNEEGSFICLLSWNEHWESFQRLQLLLLQWTWPLISPGETKRKRC